jgi:hypothetical protein
MRFVSINGPDKYGEKEATARSAQAARGQTEGKDGNDNQTQNCNTDQTKNHQMTYGGFTIPQNRPTEKATERMCVRTAALFAQLEEITSPF